MTINAARQPKGLPVGGQFAAASHAEPVVNLDTAAPKTIRERFDEREEVYNRATRLREQQENIDQLHQAHSVRFAAATLLNKYPDAATLRISENVDGENQFDILTLSRADGSVIEDTDDDDAWTYEEPFRPGPDLNELVWALNPRDNRWAAGIGKISGGGRDLKTVDIDLNATLNSPPPRISDEQSPYTRSFSLDEQKALVDTAYDGLSDLEDKVSERAMDYEPEDLRRIQEQLDTVNAVLSNTGSE